MLSDADMETTELFEDTIEAGRKCAPQSTAE